MRFIKKKIRILHFIKSYSYLCRITSAKDLIDVNYLLALKAPKCTFYAADIVLKGLLPNGLLSEWSISIVQ
ncbi:hypothetical protein DWY73_03540 [Bacteroides fragilis]|uniref:Uncharacterized protein n=1 Tax=Bacteroides fragilis TaxID=817 RepID=A0A6L3GSK5_BACFG|nr:hypothetical protein F3B31_19035 [Bacteroides fragilis]KAA4748024.1 hypothetical protein F3B16_20660 [Bacteroides fragilis]KAA4750099.1 hypothetical protein F3B44_16675 [Bacteroides fragilis]KAA4920172.1 hypothetical protein F2014_17320 [Bacteroides fragilis]KAA5039850.1 hypothetical protein F2Z62_18175 [Bacteroides fragilis]